MVTARWRLLATLPLAGLLAALGGGLAAGCGTGQQSQTAMQESAADGANGQIGPIAVRDARLAFPSGSEHFYPTGSDATLLLTIVNTGTTEDELASVTSPIASVRVDGQRTLPPQRAARAVGEPDKAAGAAAQNLGLGQIRLVLEDLAEDVRPGKTVPVTLLFRQAGELTLQVPVGPTDEPRSDEH